MMFIFDFKDLPNVNEYVELVKMFLRPSEFDVYFAGRPSSGVESDGGRSLMRWVLPDSLVSADDGTKKVADKNALKRSVFDFLVGAGLKAPEWGILTGVRPVKLFGELARADAAPNVGGGAIGHPLPDIGITHAEQILKRNYYLSDGKIALLREIYLTQKKLVPEPEPNSVALYIGIPFCPTRCEYCSFPSNQVKYDKIAPYLAALEKELRFVAAGMEARGFHAESIYLGGGTPTTLNGRDLDCLLGLVTSLLASPRLKEFTVEAGRPDTIGRDKLESMKRHGVGRLSVNPQSMNGRTLELIGRAHGRDDVEKAFALARETGIDAINSDIIAGLPEETPADFRRTMEGILVWEPENVTVHTLAMKRAARLKEQDSEYNYGRGQAARDMLAIARETLARAGYEPYYLYRQKQAAGNLENVGYAKDGKICLYNVRIMEEDQTVIALGAGGSTKVFYPEGNRLERVFNVSNYEEYVARVDEMIDRKRDACLF